MKRIILTLLVLFASITNGLYGADEDLYNNVTDALKEVSAVKDLSRLSASKVNTIIRTTDCFMYYVLKNGYDYDDAVNNANITYNFIITSDAYDNKTKKQNLSNFIKTINVVVSSIKGSIDREKSGLARIKHSEYSSQQEIQTAENNFNYKKDKYNKIIKDLRKVQSQAKMYLNTKL